MDKRRVVCYLNQFFGQIGGEEKADIGISAVEGAVGPAGMVQSELGDFGEVVATVICGDNYMADNPETAVPEALEVIKQYKPDLFIAGPAFNAGRYGLNCGKLCEVVGEKLGIPTVTGMYHENAAVELYRTKTYIIYTGMHAADMKKAVPKMVSIGKRLCTGEPIGSAKAEGYAIRNVIKNDFADEIAAVRAINMLLKKVKGEPFETEMQLAQFEDFEPAQPVSDIKKAKIAIISDGGLVPEDNPDKIKSFCSTTWGEYNIDELLNNPHTVEHGGYDCANVIKDPNRLLPVDVLRELKEKGEFGELYPNVFMAGGNCASVDASKKIGQEIMERLKEEGITAAILTST